MTVLDRCELWAPWSEELGRWSVLQWSLGLVNLWQIPQLLAVQLAKEDSRQLVGGMIVIFRVLGGLCSAGGSVTLAVVADMVRYGLPWTEGDANWRISFVTRDRILGCINQFRCNQKLVDMS